MTSIAPVPGPRRWLAAAALALGPLAALADKSAADYYVRNLPGLPKGETPVKMHAGYATREPSILRNTG